MIRFKGIYFTLILAVTAVFIGAGCSSLPLQKARSEFYSGDLNRADYILDGCKGVSEKDILLCYMERGTILHYMGTYEESTEVLLKASKLIESQDYISVTDQSSAVLVNDRVTTYKGEYSERLWVHTYLMMNFLLQHRYESALVEARQALEVYDRYAESLAGDHFTRALIALCFENMNMPDDARIEYEKLAEETGGEKFAPVPVPQGKGELIIFIGEGRAPVKVSGDIVMPPSIRISIPVYADGSFPDSIDIMSDGNTLDAVNISTDLGQVARKSLDDRSAQYLTRQALRAGAKEAIAQEIGEETIIGEVFARAILFLLEEADTRSWETLPGGLTLVRIPLDAGLHDLEISSAGSETVHLDGIDIPEGGKIYQSIRFP